MTTRSTAAARTTASRTTASRTTASRTSSVRASSPRASSARAVAPRGTAPRPELRVLAGGAATRARSRVRAVRSGRTPFVLLVVALLVGTTLGLLILNTAIAVDSLKATQLRAENAQRAQEVQRLEQQVVTGGTPAEIARAAVAAGLVPAGTAAYLILGPDGNVTLRGTPTPAEPPAGPADGG